MRQAGKGGSAATPEPSATLVVIIPWILVCLHFCFHRYPCFDNSPQGLSEKYIPAFEGV
jgi:hypothetical protein